MDNYMKDLSTPLMIILRCALKEYCRSFLYCKISPTFDKSLRDALKILYWMVTVCNNDMVISPAHRGTTSRGHGQLSGEVEFTDSLYERQEERESFGGREESEQVIKGTQLHHMIQGTCKQSTEHTINTCISVSMEQ